MKKLWLLIFLFGCEQKPCVVNVPAPPPPPPPSTHEKYQLIEGTFWTTSQAGTVLAAKTMFRFNAETGETDYLRDGVWYVTK